MSLGRWVTPPERYRPQPGPQRSRPPRCAGPQLAAGTLRPTPPSPAPRRPQRTRAGAGAGTQRPQCDWRSQRGARRAARTPTLRPRKAPALGSRVRGWARAKDRAEGRISASWGKAGPEQQDPGRGKMGVPSETGGVGRGSPPECSGRLGGTFWVQDNGGGQKNKGALRGREEGWKGPSGTQEK